MRLSEAIRLGAMMKPQAFTQWVNDESSSCALLAASEAIGLNSVILFDCRIPNYPAFKELYPFLETEVQCPECMGQDVRRTMSIIWHLNDFHRMTRERIADWIELHEPLGEILEANIAEEVAL